jgi:hypothetical protein
MVFVEGSRLWFVSSLPHLAHLTERADDLRVPPQETRLAFVKLCLELELFNPALLVLQGVMAGDDQDVEAWYLEGWCFFLMAEQARESGGTLDDLTWEDLGKDARDCLEMCHTVSPHVIITTPTTEHGFSCIQIKSIPTSRCSCMRKNLLVS